MLSLVTTLNNIPQVEGHLDTFDDFSSVCVFTSAKYMTEERKGCSLSEGYIANAARNGVLGQNIFYINSLYPCLYSTSLT